MYRGLAVPMIAGLIVGACGSGDEPTRALAVVEAQHAAAADGDSDKAREFWAANAVFTYPEGFGIDEIEVWSDAPFLTEDYDGDGTPSVADIVQTKIALTDAFSRTVEMDCTEISESVVECTDYVSDVFTRAAGVEDPGLAYRMTIDDDLIVQRDYSIEQVAGWPAVDAFDSAVETEVRRYEQWIFDTHHELHPVMFQGSCCTGLIATTTDSVEQHTQTMPEYQKTLEP